MIFLAMFFSNSYFDLTLIMLLQNVYNPIIMHTALIINNNHDAVLLITPFAIVHDGGEAKHCLLYWIRNAIDSSLMTMPEAAVPLPPPPPGWAAPTAACSRQPWQARLNGGALKTATAETSFRCISKPLSNVKKAVVKANRYDMSNLRKMSTENCAPRRGAAQRE